MIDTVTSCATTITYTEYNGHGLPLDLNLSCVLEDDVNLGRHHLTIRLGDFPWEAGERGGATGIGTALAVAHVGVELKQKESYG